MAEHRPYGLDCKCGRPINSDNDWARHLEAELKVARIAVVELPEPDKYGRFWYGNHCNYTFADTGEVETSRVYQRIDPPTLREYAAALLAAADAVTGLPFPVGEMGGE